MNPTFIKYDLHSHSNISDGMFSPTELIERAANMNVQVLALTDHDAIAGLPEAALAAAKYNIRLISGIELSVNWGKDDIHIVGLNFDPNHPAIINLVTAQQEARELRAQKISELLAKILDVHNAYEKIKPSVTAVTRAHYANYLVEIGKVKDVAEAFKKYLGNHKPAYVNTKWCDLEHAINILHQAGGVAIIAHPMKYDFTNNKIKKLITEFKQLAGDGMEVASCGQTRDQRSTLIKWCNDADLYASVGSDFHFPNSWIELGKSLHLPENCKPIWTLF